MNTWIFQSVPDQFDLRLPASLRPGETVTWYATRYRDQMAPDDIAYFWMGGDPEIRGIYGWGVLTSPAYIKKNWDSHGVDVKVTARFGKPLLAAKIRENLQLRSMLILRQPAASNFLLSPEEASQLSRMVKESHEAPPSERGR